MRAETPAVLLSRTNRARFLNRGSSERRATCQLVWVQVPFFLRLFTGLKGFFVPLLMYFSASPVPYDVISLPRLLCVFCLLPRPPRNRRGWPGNWPGAFPTSSREFFPSSFLMLLTPIPMLKAAHLGRDVGSSCPFVQCGLRPRLSLPGQFPCAFLPVRRKLFPFLTETKFFSTGLPLYFFLVLDTTSRAARLGLKTLFVPVP